MKSYTEFLNEMSSQSSVKGLEYKTSPDDNFDSIMTKSGNQIRISQKHKNTYILGDGSYFVSKYKEKGIKSENPFTHFYVYLESGDSRISLDKFKLHLKDLQEIFGKDLENTLIYSDDRNYKIVDNKGNILEEK